MRVANDARRRAVAADAWYVVNFTPIRLTARVGRTLAIALIRTYQLVLSPWLGPTCRYEPSCSAYAIEAIQRRGLVKGSWLAMCRIGRCHPFAASGYDPVP